MAVEDIVGADEALRDAGVARIEAFVEEQPLAALGALSLAGHYRRTGDVDRAIEMFARVVAFPGAESGLSNSISQIAGSPESPSEILPALWKEKHGSEDGLSDYLNELYQTYVDPVGDGPAEGPRTDGNVALLCELFTGAGCPPCVAIDLGLNSARRFPKDEVIVLRYHVHVPVPDPLSNVDSMNRLDFYEAEGTPALMLNGNNIDGVGGYLEEANVRAQVMHALLKTNLSRELKTETTVSASATREADVVTFNASASKAEDEPNWRLIGVLAEKKIEFAAANGIRYHEMIVRDLPLGADGVSFEGGKAQAQVEVNLKELRNELDEHIDLVQTQTGFEISNRPLDLAELSFVALVQNIETRQIEQSVVVDIVTGPASLDSSDNAETTATVDESESSSPEPESTDASPSDSDATEEAPTETEAVSPQP